MKQNSVGHQPPRRRGPLWVAGLALFLTAAWLGMAGRAIGAPFTWAGGTGAGPFDWNLNTNWSPAGFPNSSTDIATIDATWTAAPTIQLNQAIALEALTLDGDGAFPITIAPNGGGLSFTNFSSAIVTANGSGASPHLISANISVTTFFLDVVTNSDLKITGNLGFGFYALRKQGAGTLILTGDNAYASDTFIQAGTLQIGDGGSTGSIIGHVFNEGALVFSRTGSVVTYGGNISGSGTVAKNGGPLVLTGANTYTGDTSVNGVLAIGDGGTFGSIVSDVVFGTAASLRFNRSNDWTYGGVISGPGTVLQQGAGMTTLTGDSTYNGVTTISNGVLRIGNGGTTGSIVGDVTNNSFLVFNRSGSLTYGGAISGTGAVTKLGTGAVIFTGNHTYDGLTSVDAGVLSIGDGGTSGSIAGDIDIFAGTLSFNRSDAVTYSGTISGAVFGILQKSGGGTLTLTSDNTFSGNTIISEGTLQLGNGGATGSVAGNIGNDSALVFNHDGFTSFSNVISGTGTVTKLGSNTLLLDGNNTYSGVTTISDGTLQIGSGGTTGTVAGDIENEGTLIFDRSDELVYAGNISGSGDLVKNGEGTLILTGNATHTGGTTINEGTLQIGNNGLTGSISGDIENNSALAFVRVGSVLTYSGVISGNGTVSKSAGPVVFTGDNTYTGLTTVSGSLTIGDGGTTGAIVGDILLAGAPTLRFNRSNSYTHAGLISGLGAVSQIGSGTTTLTANNDYTGVTNINNGTLAIASDANIGSTSGVNLNGGTLQFTSATATNLDFTVGAAHGAIVANGILDFDGNLSLNGNTLTVNQGIRFGASQNIATHGIIQSADSLLTPFVNNGFIDGVGPQAADGLTLTGYVMGTGSYGGNITMTGTFAPGLSPAEVFLENLNFTDSSTLAIELGGTTAGSQYDLLTISDTGTLDGMLDIDLINGFLPQLGDQFTIITAGTLLGNFDAFVGLSLPNGLYLMPSIQSDSFILTTVPEPSALALTGIVTLAGLLSFRARRRRRSR